MSGDFQSQYNAYQDIFDSCFVSYFEKIESSLSSYYMNQLSEIAPLKDSLGFNEAFSENYRQHVGSFLKSIKYSSFSKGKRFRPILSLAVADMFGAIKNTDILTYATSVEMIHTYSLIHDDLPCMDNDDFRRGEPTNHKVFGESTALLSGDALLTLAFENLAENFNQPTRGHFKALQELASASGVRGMVSGQYVDLAGQQSQFNMEEILLVHLNKTGALIRASVMGPCEILNLSEQDKKSLERFSILMGLAFQIKDDLLDIEKNEKGSFPFLLGAEKTSTALAKTSQFAIDAIHGLSKCDFLISLVEYNLKRDR